MFRSAHHNVLLNHLFWESLFLGVRYLITHTIATALLRRHRCFRDVIPRAGQTVHYGLILAFFLFLNYFPVRLFLCRSVFSVNVFTVGCFVCSLLLLFTSSGMICLVSALYWNDSIYNRRRKDWMLMAVATLAVSRLRSAFASVFARLLLSIDFFLQLNTARQGIRNNRETLCAAQASVAFVKRNVLITLKYSPCSSCCHALILYYNKYIQLSSL